MAWISCDFLSKTLNMPVEAEILVPQPDGKRMLKTKDYKVIVLLHGANGDRTEWLLKSPIADLVSTQPILVFMPSVKNSFYVNMANGYRYMDYITKEIPEFIKAHFPVSKNREDWLIAGESMGGYGAMLCGLCAAEQFGNIASFSGTMDIMDERLRYPMFQMELAFGEDWEKTGKSDHNLFLLCRKVADLLEREKRPNIFLNCGKQDYLHKMNVDYYNTIKDHFDVWFTDGDGMHDFTYWNERLKEMIPWFLGKSCQEVML